MKLPEEPEKRKEIQTKLLDTILTDQLKMKKRNIISMIVEFLKEPVWEKNKPILNNIVDYFHDLSSVVFDSFVCESGFEMSNEDLEDTILFYYII